MPSRRLGGRAYSLTTIHTSMVYTFAAERKLVFVVQTGGHNRLVEFGDRNQNGTSVFATTDANVAAAVRRSSLYRRGVIIETTREPEPAAPSPSPGTSAFPGTSGSSVTSGSSASPEVREYDNFTVAREAIVKEFGIKKSEVRNPTALARVAQEHGFNIKYLNAER